MSRKSKPALLAALSIATVLVFSCASSGKAKPFGPFTLQGMIYDRSGTSVANAAIFFEGR
jgi:hypothetical protein